jgi:hypothetical protein
VQAIDGYDFSNRQVSVNLTVNFLRILRERRLVRSLLDVFKFRGRHAEGAEEATRADSGALVSHSDSWKLGGLTGSVLFAGKCYRFGMAG